ADQSRISPDLPGPRHQFTPLLAVESSERLIQNYQSNVGSQHRPSETHSLALSARNQCAAVAERSLKTFGKSIEHASKFRRFDHLSNRQRSIGGRAVEEIVDE